MQIPKIIHQIWIQGVEKMPAAYRQGAASWRLQNPDWEYHLWDDESLQSWMGTEYPQLLPVYTAYDAVVARADIGRYAVLHACGGVYVDTDTICVRPIETHLALPGVTFYVQVYDNPQFEVCAEEQLEHVSNAFIACSPQHPFWRHVFHHLTDAEHPQPAWIVATGPEMFRDCLKNYLAQHGDVRFLDRERIVTAYYLSKHYLRWYAWRTPSVFAIHHNDSARTEWRPSLRSWLWPTLPDLSLRRFVLKLLKKF